MAAGGLMMCIACNKELIDENDLKNHYMSEWHRYNLKRKIAGVPGVTEALFLARQSTRAEEKHKLKGAVTRYTCGLCNKEYISSKAYDQHLKSRAHASRVSHDGDDNESITMVKPLPTHVEKEESDEASDGSNEWEEVDQNDELVNQMEMDRVASDDNLDEDEDDDDDDDDDDDNVDPTCCFMCDKEHKTIEKCMVHMHKRHGFFIPDVEYLKDPAGLLTYIGLKVKRDFACLYCNINCHPFDSLEAVRKHMAAKSHCKVHYGDGGEEDEAELDDFYDYSSSYINGNGKQLVTADNSHSIRLGTGGSELIITRATDDGISIKAIGSREYLRYYRQKPRPSPNAIFITALLAARYRTMGLSTVQLRENMVRMKVFKQMNRSGVETMRCKIGMRSNVIRNLPKNVTY